MLYRYMTSHLCGLSVACFTFKSLFTHVSITIIMLVWLCPCLTKPETRFLFSCELLQSCCGTLFDTSEPVIYLMQTSFCSSFICGNYWSRLQLHSHSLGALEWQKKTKQKKPNNLNINNIFLYQTIHSD